MKVLRKNRYLRYFMFITLVIYMARFILTGQTQIVIDAFKPFIQACIFIYFFAPFTKFIQRKTHLKKLPSLILAYSIFFLIIGLFIGMIIPSIINSIQLFIENVSEYDEEQIIAWIQAVPLASSFVNTSNFSTLFNSLEQYVVDYSSDLLTYSGNILSSIGAVLQSIIIFVFAIILSFLALKDTHNLSRIIEDFIYAFLSKPSADRFIRIMKLTDQAVKNYIVGKFYACMILGILVGVSIAIVNLVTPLHIPYAPLIGMIVGVTNIIPYIGGTIGTIPSVIIAVFSGGWEALAVLIIITVIQQIDNLIVSPKMISDSVGLKPFWVIASITIGGSLFGALGMIVAAPIVSVILFLVDEKIQLSKQDIESKKEEASPPLQ